MRIPSRAIFVYHHLVNHFEIEHCSDSREFYVTNLQLDICNGQLLVLFWTINLRFLQRPGTGFYIHRNYPFMRNCRGLDGWFNYPFDCLKSDSIFSTSQTNIAIYPMQVNLQVVPTCFSVWEDLPSSEKRRLIPYTSNHTGAVIVIQLCQCFFLCFFTKPFWFCRRFRQVICSSCR